MNESNGGGAAFKISIGLAFVGGYADASSYLLARTFTGHLTGHCVLAAPKRDDLESVVFLRDELVPIVRPDHPRRKAGSAPLTLRQLCAESMIMREAGSGTREVIESALGQTGSKITTGSDGLGQQRSDQTGGRCRPRGGDCVAFDHSNGVGVGPIGNLARARLPVDPTVAPALLAQPSA